MKNQKIIYLLKKDKIFFTKIFKIGNQKSKNRLSNYFGLNT